MRKIERVYYDAESLGGFGLNCSPDETKTPEGIKRVIDRTNDHHRKNDYRAEQFYIYRHTFTRIFDDNNKLIAESSFMCRTELYPTEPDKTPRYTVVKESAQIPFIMSSYDVSKAVRCCEHTPGSYVKNNTGEIVYRCSKNS